MNSLRLIEVAGTVIGVLGILLLAHGVLNGSTWGGLLGVLCLFGGAALAGGVKLYVYLRK